MSLIPSTVSLIRDSKRPRISAESAALTIQCLLGSGPRELSLHCVSKISGDHGAQWVEVSSQWGGTKAPDNPERMEGMGLYQWVFQVRGNLLTELLAMTTPKGAEYDIEEDGGSPFNFITLSEQRKLTELVITKRQAKCNIRVLPAWVVSVEGAKPIAGGRLFYDEGEASSARDKLEAEWRTYNGNMEKVEAAHDKEEKEIAKARTTVAHRATGKGLTKKKK